MPAIAALPMLWGMGISDITGWSNWMRRKVGVEMKMLTLTGPSRTSTTLAISSGACTCRSCGRACVPPRGSMLFLRWLKAASLLGESLGGYHGLRIRPTLGWWQRRLLMAALRWNLVTWGSVFGCLFHGGAIVSFYIPAVFYFYRILNENG